MKNNNIQIKKRFGQNFLNNKEIISKIVNEIDIENKDIIEIGPGHGALTNLLVQKCKTLDCYEIDNDLIPILQVKFKENNNFTLYHQDFLDVNFNWNNKKMIIANIPYNITSQILFKIFENINKFSHAIIMIQKEVAERILAKEKMSNYGKLSVICQYFANIKLVTLVDKKDFIPVPKVDSAVIRFDFDKNSIYNIQFLDFIKTCFSMQRKTLVNNLKNTYKIVDINKILNGLKLNLNIRPQEISLDNYILLFNLLKL